MWILYTTLLNIFHSFLTNQFPSFLPAKRKETMLILLIFMIFLYTYLFKIKTFIFTSKPEKFYFSCQIKWLNIVPLWSFSYRQIIWHKKVNLFRFFTWKIVFDSLGNLNRPNKWNIVLKFYLKKDNVVWIRLQHKISFVTSFTISKWLKKY